MAMSITLKNALQWMVPGSMLLLGALALGLPIVAQQLTIDVNPSANFSRYHTYSWRGIQASDPDVARQIKDAVARDLRARGWVLVADGGDVSIAAAVATRDQEEYATVNNGAGAFGWRRGWGNGFAAAGAPARQIPAGTLILEVYETAARQLVWSGTAIGKKPDENERRVDKVVKKLLSRLPSKGVK
jgi:uncharacterized protein DUF4136